MIYYVYGDYGYESQCELEVFNSAERAVQFVKGYTKYGDMGGYGQIEAAYFAEDGEYVTLYRVTTEEFA